jgi:transcriptional regulatory protein GAL4
VNEPTLYSSLIAQSKFHLVVNKISNRLLSSPPISDEEALALNSAVELWATTLPWYIQLDSPTSFSYDWHLFALPRLWWRFWNLQIILTRPFLLQWATKRIDSQNISIGDRKQSECRQLCVKSAHMTINSIDKYIRHNQLSRLASWYTLYVISTIELEFRIFSIRYLC